MKNCQRKIRELIAISVILPGLVDPESGVIRYMPHIQVENWGLVEALEKNALTSPVFVGHDIRSPGVGRALFLAQAGLRGLYSGARTPRYRRGHYFQRAHFFIGRNGNVGEIGHIRVDPLGERCHCGNFGCLETVAANAAIEHRVRHLLEQGYQKPHHA